MIWGFAGVGVSLNTARDVGGRIAALSIWGSEAAGGNYAAIAALVNIPAMLISGVIYELFFHDSSRGKQFSFFLPAEGPMLTGNLLMI